MKPCSVREGMAGLDNPTLTIQIFLKRKPTRVPRNASSCSCKFEIYRSLSRSWRFIASAPACEGQSKARPLFARVDSSKSKSSSKACRKLSIQLSVLGELLSSQEMRSCNFCNARSICLTSSSNEDILRLVGCWERKQNLSQNGYVAIL